MAKMKFYDWIAFALLDVAALNWGTIAVFDFNFVDWLLNYIPFEMLPTIVYSIVGIAGIYGLFSIIKLANK